ncbi:MAG: nucleotidyltransferase domain-containing protein [Bacilli bacterium]|nr:nucleotidyltransferase domain-containing protein [Bacilli bacterium]MBR2892197.1 nucleotidyltransferase domain-containing protein [Bacilli bacterium]
MNTNKYNLPFYIYKINNRRVQKVRFKDIVLDKEIPNSYEEAHYKEITDTYMFLMNNVKSNIDISLFIKSYFLLTNKRISKKNAFKLLEIYYLYKDCNIVELLLFLLEEISKQIRFRRNEYGLLIVNYFFKKYEDEEIEIYQSMFNSLRVMFSNKENIIAALLMLKRSLNYKSEQGFINIKKEEILDFFHINKKEVKDRFLIKRLFLFGSFSENMNHNHSDLDLLVIFNDSITNGEKIILIKKLEKYIEEKLKIPTDVINFEYAITSMDFMSLNKILTIY